MLRKTYPRNLVLILLFGGGINVLHKSKMVTFFTTNILSQILHSSGQTILDTVKCNDWSFPPLQGIWGQVFEISSGVYLLRL